MKKFYIIIIFVLLIGLATWLIINSYKPETITTTTTEEIFTIEKMRITAITLTGYLLESPNIFDTKIYTANASNEHTIYAIDDIVYVRVFGDDLMVEIIALQDTITTTTIGG